MKVRRLLSVGILLLASVQAVSVQAMPQFQKMYTYYDSNGNTVGYKYLPCDGRVYQGGEITQSFDIEELPCGQQLPELPLCDPMELYQFCIN